MTDTRSFHLDGRLQIIFAAYCGMVIEALQDQKEHKVEFVLPGLPIGVRYVDDEESDRRIRLLEDFRREVWDGAAADLLSRGLL